MDHGLVVLTAWTLGNLMTMGYVSTFPDEAAMGLSLDQPLQLVTYIYNGLHMGEALMFCICSSPSMQEFNTFSFSANFYWPISIFIFFSIPLTDVNDSSIFWNKFFLCA